MLLVLSKWDIVVTALIDALKSGSLEHFIDHRVQLCKLLEAGLALATLFAIVRMQAISADNFVAARTVLGFHSDIVAVGTSCCAVLLLRT